MQKFARDSNDEDFEKNLQLWIDSDLDPKSKAKKYMLDRLYQIGMPDGSTGSTTYAFKKIKYIMQRLHEKHFCVDLYRDFYDFYKKLELENIKYKKGANK